jgi:Spy/CpxP family protein refolding chaperone
MLNSTRKSSLLKFYMLAMALILPLSFAQAQDSQSVTTHGPMRENAMGGHELRFLSRYLNLTDTQKAQIKQLLENEKSSMEPLMQQEHQGHLQMTQLVQSGNFDETKAQTIATSLSQTTAQSMVQRAKVDAEIFQLLTPEQKTKMTQLTMQREQRFTQHMQRQQQSDLPQTPND